MKENDTMKEVKCELCGRIKEGKKVFQKHHIDYNKDITILICYTCHSYVHGRSFMKMRNLWELKYGKDRGFVELCKRFMEVYIRKLGTTNRNLK